MTAGFDYQGISILIGAIVAGVISLGGFVLTLVSFIKKLNVVHDLVNGVATDLAAANKKVASAHVEIAGLEGETRGRLEEQAAPKVAATVPGKTELSQPTPKPRRPKTRETPVKPRTAAKKK